MGDVVAILVIVAVGGVGVSICAWRYRLRRSQRIAEALISAGARRCAEALEVVARAESLAELALVVHRQPALSTMWEVLGRELARLSDSTRSLCQTARTFAF